MWISGRVSCAVLRCRVPTGCGRSSSVGERRHNVHSGARAIPTYPRLYPRESGRTNGLVWTSSQSVRGGHAAAARKGETGILARALAARVLVALVGLARTMRSSLLVLGGGIVVYSR